jgi:hypothetical protein
MSIVNEMHTLLACLSAYCIPESTNLISMIYVLHLMLSAELNYGSDWHSKMTHAVHALQ